MGEREPQGPEQGREGAIPKARFELGQIVVTTGALEALKTVERHPVQLIARHVSGEWGDLPPEDVEENELSLEKGYRIFSAYRLDGGHKFYVITEHDRSVTTLLLAEEY